MTPPRSPMVVDSTRNWPAICRLEAPSAAQADLPDPLHDRHQCHVGDADGSDDQRDQSEDQEQAVDVPLHSLARLGRVGWCRDGESVLGSGSQRDRCLVGDLVRRAEGGVDQDPGHRSEAQLVLGGRGRQDHRGGELLLAFGSAEDPDHRVGLPLEEDRGGILYRADAEESCGLVAEHRHAVVPGDVALVDEAPGGHRAVHGGGQRGGRGEDGHGLAGDVPGGHHVVRAHFDVRGGMRVGDRRHRFDPGQPADRVDTRPLHERNGVGRRRRRRDDHRDRGRGEGVEPADDLISRRGRDPDGDDQGGDTEDRTQCGQGGAHRTGEHPRQRFGPQIPEVHPGTLEPPATAPAPFVAPRTSPARSMPIAGVGVGTRHAHLAHQFEDACLGS